MFYSILFQNENQNTGLNKKAPDCFGDLGLARIFESILRKEKDYGLEGFFYTPLQDAGLIEYRQQVLKELQQQKELQEILAGFSREIYRTGKYMETLREDMFSGDSWRNNYLARGHMLDCAGRYCASADRLLKTLSGMQLQSEGLRGFADYLKCYCKSEKYTSLKTTVSALRESFSKLHYCMLIKNGTVKVKKYEGEEDLSEQVLKSFEKFRQGDASDYRQELPQEPYADHVEAAVLSLLSGIYPEEFKALDAFSENFRDFADSGLLRFSGEIRFYLSWLNYISPVKKAGLPFCFPKLVQDGGRLSARDFYDLALADLLGDRTVTNSFSLEPPERIIVITGPNQGGKTTFARAFGQLHYLASLGLSVPGSEAELLLSSGVLTHFEREEELEELSGRLQDDLRRLKALLDRADSRSVIIVNEIFTSTTLQDAVKLGGRMMDAIAALGAPAVVVSFMDELAQHGPETVSMMSSVLPEDPAQRSFKIERRPPDGLAYAMYIARRHGLSYEELSGRLRG